MAVNLGIVPRMRRRIAGSFLQKTARARCPRLCADVRLGMRERMDDSLDARRRASELEGSSTRPVGSYLGSACARGRLVAECGRVRRMSACGRACVSPWVCVCMWSCVCVCV